MKKYSLSEKEISSENILKLCLGVLEGTAQPHLMSQEIPDDWNDNPVKILVGKNIEKVAFDETKNVFVMFYAPWCAHCKELTPTWENLAEKYKDHENIIIAKIDATANDIEVVSVPGYPAIKYFPAGKERKVRRTAVDGWQSPLIFRGHAGQKDMEEDDLLWQHLTGAAERRYHIHIHLQSNTSVN
uniref:Thioredoxin domain-containing protein n=1 Tax=Erpetoichthys calabaricus TaxID=27687 RepID=A0A8C4TDE3_ERPCA